MAELVVTMGDPAGIGPEVVVRALARREKELEGRVLVVGEAAWLNRVAAKLGRPAGGCEFYELAAAGVDSLKEPSRPGIAVFNPCADPLPQLALGRDYAVFGEASFSYVKAGVELVRQRAGRALVTAPISKHAWHLAGHRYPGHTELLQELDGSNEVGMMFWGEKLKVLLITTHLPLAGVAAALTPELVAGRVKLLHRFLNRVGRAGEIGLAALNPHAGEQGAFGDEEARILRPAVAALQAAGVPVAGPVPADVLFHQALAGRYAAVAALYHDQGLVPFKMLHFHDGVNLTLGLSFIRTSVDHGTAFDISDKFTADSRSLEAAMRLALELQEGADN
jgi:4-hydroxythreonine-4-phosphate dehydrogenase